MKTPRHLLTHASVGLAIVLSGGALAGEIIRDVSASTDLGGDATIGRITDGSGLPASFNFSHHHQRAVIANTWSSFSGAPGSITFDLGGGYELDGLAVWNYHSNSDWGVKDLSVETSADGINFASLAGGPTTFARGNSHPQSQPAEVFSFSPVVATHVRFNVLSTHGEQQGIGLAEVAFTGSTGDECVAPTPIEPGSISTTIFGQGGTLSDDGSCGASFDFIDAWYIYTPALSGTVTVDTCGAGSLDSILTIYDDCPNRGGMSIACNNDAPGCGVGSSVTIDVIADQPIYVRVSDDTNVGVNNYTLTLTIDSVQNDECNSPFGLFAGSTIGNLADQTGSTGDDTPCALNDTRDEWYLHVPVVSGPVVLTTCSPNSDFDTVLSVFDGCPDLGGVPIACNDDANAGVTLDCVGGTGSSGSRLSYLSFDALAGEAYYVRVSAFNDQITLGGATGTFELTLVPPGDECYNVVPATVGANAGSLAAGTGSTDDSSCGNADIVDAWHEYTATTDGIVEFNTCSSAFDSVLAVYDACPSSAGIELACSTDAANERRACDGGSFVSMAATAGMTYRIRVSAVDDAIGNGSYTLQILETSGEGNACFVAPQVSEGTVGGNLLDNTASTTSGCLSGDDIDEWFAYTPSVSGPVNVTTCSPVTAFDSSIAIHDTCPEDGASPFACNDNAVAGVIDCIAPGVDPSEPRLSFIQFDATAGQTVYIRVASRGDVNSGDFELRITPAGDECQDARIVGVGTTAGSLAGRTGATGTDQSCGSGDTIDEWFMFTATATGAAQFSVCSSDPALVPNIAVWDGCAGFGGLMIACRADGEACAEPLEIATVAARVYLIRVSAFADVVASGNFELRIDNHGDVCALAKDLNDGSTVATLADNTATGLNISCGPGNSVDEWYALTPSAGGQVLITTCAPETVIDTVLMVYDGCPSQGGQQLYCDDDSASTTEYDCYVEEEAGNLASRIEFEAAAGSTYYVRVARYNGALDEYELIVVSPECPCDTVPDGVVNVNDLLAYLASWFNGAPPADLNGDDVVNINDLLEYIACWFAAEGAFCA